MNVSRRPLYQDRSRSAGIRRLTAVVVAGFALSLVVSEQALAEPGPSTSPTAKQSPAPTTAPPTPKNRKTSAVVDGNPGFVNLKTGAAEGGGRVAQLEPPAGKPFTQKQLADKAKARAVAQKQRSYVESSTLDEPSGPHTAAAPGIDLPTAPLEAEQKDCLGADGADSSLGRVHNRYLYCLKRSIQVEYWELDTKGVPVELAGTSTLDFTIMAYASKQSRSIRVFFKATEDSADYDRQHHQGSEPASRRRRAVRQQRPTGHPVRTRRLCGVQDVR
jgi:hypothetical protein